MRKFAFMIVSVLPALVSAQVSVDTGGRKQTDLIDIFNKRYHTDGAGFKRVQKNRLTLSILPDPNATRQDEFFITPIFSCFYLGNIKETKMSQISFAPYFTFSGKFIFPVRAFIYTWRNKFNLTLDYRFMHYSQKLYELGKNPSKQEQSELHYQQYRFHQFISRKLVKNLFLGCGGQMDHYYEIKEEPATSDSSDYIKYTDEGTTKVNTYGIAAQVMYDTRQNNINSEYGMLFRSTFRYNPPWMNSTQTSSSLFTELRKFFPLVPMKHRILAFWSIYWTNLYGKPYYLDLPSIGWDVYNNSGRGVYKNSIRGNGLLYFETEYRTDLTANGLWGGVIFMNITSSSYDSYHFREWYPAAGAGLRLKWNKKYGGNIRFDVGFSRNYISVYTGIAENF